MRSGSRPRRFGETVLGRARAMRLVLATVLAVALVPFPAAPSAFAARQGETIVVWSDRDSDGAPELYGIDWDGDGLIDEWWHDDDEDGVIDRVEVENTGGDTFRSPRCSPGARVKPVPLAGGGRMVATDWNGDGRYDESWWDANGDGRFEDTDTYETESKVVDNTKSTRFRGVFVGVNNPPLEYAEKDVDDLCDTLDDHTPSWDAADMTKLKGAAATPAAIQGAIDAAKASSKPGDEFVFHFSGHGGGWNRAKGQMGGGFVDSDGDESANRVPERDFGRFDGSDMATPSPGKWRVRRLDMDGDGGTDTQVIKDETGRVFVRRRNATPPPEWRVAGSDITGDGDVDEYDGGVDMNGDGDKDDFVGIDDTIQVAGGVEISDDTMAQWLSGFPESVTIVVILDCCHAGSLTNDLQRLTDKAGRPLRPGHMEVVTAAAWDETAAEEPISNGVLTQAIIDALTPLPPSITRGHTTSLADCIGNRDDRTTTAELAFWAGPSAVTFLNTDNDGDGRRNEDDVYAIESIGGTDSLVDVDSTVVAPPQPRTVELTATDIDDDTKKGEDKVSRVVSFFDICCDPEFGSRGTPRLVSWLSGDQSFDLSGMGPAIRLHSDAPLMPGTTETPGPTLRFGIRQLPPPARPAPVTPSGPMQYGSEVYDVAVSIIAQAPALSQVTTTSAPNLDALPLPVVPGTGLRMELQPLPGVPLAVCLPAVYDTPTAQWQPIMERTVDIERNVIAFHPEHFSRYALLYLGPPPTITDPPPLPPGRLLTHSMGETVTVAWSNPTDPDFAATRVLRSATAFATGPSDPDSELVYEGTDVSQVETLPPGTYLLTAFARDLAGQWSTATTASVVVTELPGPPPPEPPKTDTTTTITTGEATITFGQLKRIEGRVTADATGVPSAAVVVEQSSNGIVYSPSGTVVVTGPDGTFDFIAHPSAKTWYRARFEGDASHTASISNPVLIRVRARIGAPVGPVSVRARARVTLRGTIAPAHPNGARVVRLYRELYLGRGRWRRTSGYVLARVSTVGDRSTYAVATTFTRGVWRLRAYHADAQHAAAWSAYGRTIRVR